MSETVIRMNSVAVANIKQWQKSKGYSQAYMATHLGISQNAYSKIELARTELPINRLFDIATVLQVSLSDLLDVTTMQTPTSYSLKG